MLKILIIELSYYKDEHSLLINNEINYYTHKIV
jgi:hypothetical protein